MIKLKLFLALVFLNIGTITAQEKLEVFFDFDQYEINADTNQKITDWINTSKNIEVQKIYGFCDWKGTNPYNDTLSLKRVYSVYDFLKNRNVKIKEDYEIKGFGKDFEQSKIQSENRKVTIVYEIIKEVVPKTKEAILLDELNETLKTSKVGDIIKLKDIYFYNNSPKLLPQSKPVLYELLCVMQDNPKLKIEVQGHICCQTKELKFDVSTSRARAVAVFLIQNGINRKRITFKGFGSTRPVHPIPEKSEQEEEDNRRVEIRIIEK
ncbi:OmpA family protein [Flavobacterium sp.]|uniref:OmpA family protein n=1 Tax=Flavobacterium sp. TaxID=239 RepID=UPI0037B9323A